MSDTIPVIVRTSVLRFWYIQALFIERLEPVYYDRSVGATLTEQLEFEAFDPVSEL